MKEQIDQLKEALRRDLMKGLLDTKFGDYLPKLGTNLPKVEKVDVLLEDRLPAALDRLAEIAQECLEEHMSPGVRVDSVETTTDNKLVVHLRVPPEYIEYNFTMYSRGPRRIDAPWEVSKWEDKDE
jgi:hypothetical protein